MTASPYSLPQAVAGFLEAPANPECEARLLIAMAGEPAESWQRRFPPECAVLANTAWRWMELALAAQGDDRADLAEILKTMINRLVARRQRAGRKQNDAAGRYRRSELPARAWWLDLD